MKKRSGLKVMLKLVGLLKPLAGFMVLAIIMGVIGNLCASFITIFGSTAILGLLGEDIGVSVPIIFISICVFALLRGVLRYAEQACNHYIAFKLLALIRNKIFSALRKLCPAKLECKDKGNLISIITSDIELLEVFYAHTVSPIIIALIFCGFFCIFIAGFSSILAVVALCAYLTVGLAIPILVSKFSGDAGIKFRTKSGELSAFVLDGLRGLNETLQYGNGKERLSEMNSRTEDLSFDEKRMKNMTGRNVAFTNTVILIFDLLMLFAASYLYQKGDISFSGVVICVISMMSSFGPCIALANLGSTLQNTFAAGNRVLDILEEIPVVSDVSNESDIVFKGARAEDVDFSYGEQKILSEVNVEIPKGAVVGIVGRSGSGKSTLLKLFMRFWETRGGKISISDTDINTINTDSLRDNESYVTQETHLFHDSIKNNLLIAKQNATEEEIIEACKKASIHDFIISLPQGYETPVGELGDTLSGGEKQRLGLARAFLHNAPFILLDEPTSNLDSLNEAVILKSLKEGHGDKTVLLVSHRKSTMVIADTVYSVENGRIS